MEERTVQAKIRINTKIGINTFLILHLLNYELGHSTAYIIYLLSQVRSLAKSSGKTFYKFCFLSPHSMGSKLNLTGVKLLVLL